MGVLTLESSRRWTSFLTFCVSSLTTHSYYRGDFFFRAYTFESQVKAGGKKTEVISAGADNEDGDDDDWVLPAPGSAGTAKKKAAGGNSKKKKGKGKK